MFKRTAVLLLALITVTLSGCGGGLPTVMDGSKKGSSTAASVKKSVEIINPLTGVSGLSAGKENDRPVAIMINNLSVAQSVQAGLAKADIVYETEVEGGITRLMAVYQDVSSVGQIGTVRSARYPYVDLALGHDAIYVHCGQDPTYCAPHLKNIDDISIDSGIKGAKRIPNGLASEHTLYAIGADLWQTLDSKFKTESRSNALWQKFADKDESVSLTGGSAKTVTIPMTRSYTATFTFDANTKTYVRSVKGVTRKDYKTGEVTAVTNLFILGTTITNYPDGYHRKVDLSSGNGYFVTGGNYTKIKWSKAGSKNDFTFTDETGAEITLNRGRSWICIVDKTNVVTNFK